MDDTLPFLSDGQLLEILLLSKTATAVHIGADARIRFANDAMISIWGKDRSVIGKSLEAALPELKGQPFIELFARVWREGLVISGSDTAAELYVNGTLQTFYFDFEYRAIKNEQGQTLCILHTAMDVTDRFLKQAALDRAMETEESLSREQVLNAELAVANEELSASNEELQQTQESLNNLNEELEGKINKRTRELAAGLEREQAMNAELVASNEELISANEELAAIIAELGESQEALRHTNNELLANKLRLEDAQAKLKKMNDEFAAINEEVMASNEELNASYEELAAVNEEMAATNEELTETQQDHERKVTELALSQNDLLMAIDAASLATFDLNAVTNKFSGNDLLKAWFGLAPADEIELSSAIDVIAEADRERVVAAIQKAMIYEFGGNYDIYYTIINPLNPKARIVRARGKGLFDQQRQPTRLSGVLYDVTEQKQDELRKNDFIGMVSHELKTPLTSLTAIVQVANAKLKDSPDKFLTGAMEKANLQVRKMSNMINGFLNISRLESGKILIDKQQFDLEELVGEIIKESEFTVTSHTIKLEPCGLVLINADRDKIGSVISNLVSNAVKYSPKGSLIGIRCSITDQNARVSVTDKGIGVNSADIRHLFDRYYRVENENYKHISGFGIGLYLSAEIVQRHNGKIWAESELGKGSTFHFELPLMG